MELRSLNRFVVIAEELHFGRAAQRLHIAESALSRQVQRLEEDLQFDLFERTNRRVKLTPAGLVFLDQIRPLIASFDAAANAARRAAVGKTGFIRVGFVSAALDQVLPGVLRSFRKECPDVELELSEMTTLQQIRNLQQNRIDIGFVRDPLPAESKELAFETVARERIAVAIPRDHPLAEQTLIDSETLATESFVLYPCSDPMSNWEKLVRRICNNAGFEPHVVQRTMQINTALSLVSAGIGIAMVPLSAGSAPHKGVTYRLLKETAFTELVATYRKQDETSAILLNFLSSIHAVVCEIEKLA